MSIHPGTHESRPTRCEIREAEALAAPLRREIARLGWTIAGMAAEGHRPSWVHTVGLLSKYAHPEFIVVGHDEGTSEVLLAQLAIRVAGGERFSHEDLVEIDPFRYELGWVHPRHFELDTFGMWEPLMEMHLHHFGPTALQVFPLDHEEVGPRLRWVLSRPQPIR